MALDIRALRSSAPFWSLRYHEEKRETLAMRQDTLEPPSLSTDRGAMLTAVVDGGYGYCATSDLSQAGLQAALDKATAWAEATKGKSVFKFDPERMPAPKGEYESPFLKERPKNAEIRELLMAECKAAKVDERIVERTASVSIVDEERLYYTNTGGGLRQRFRFPIPKARGQAKGGGREET